MHPRAHTLACLQKLGLCKNGCAGSASCLRAHFNRKKHTKTLSCTIIHSLRSTQPRRRPSARTSCQLPATDAPLRQTRGRMRARASEPLPPVTSDSLFQVKHTYTNTPSHTNNDMPRISVYLPLSRCSTQTTRKRRWTKQVDIDACVFFYVWFCNFGSACFVCLVLHCPMYLLPSSSLLHETSIQTICAFRSGRSPSPTDSVRSFTSTGSRANGPPSQVTSVSVHCTPRPTVCMRKRQS